MSAKSARRVGAGGSVKIKSYGWKIKWTLRGSFSADADFCKSIFVGKLLTRSTIFTCFCTAQTRIFQQHFVFFLCVFDVRNAKKFATKYLLESSWRDLQHLHAFAPLRPQYFRIFSSIFFAFFGKICKISLFLNSFHWFLLRFWWNFVGISPII